uniref:Uncharacterized protein n=1 Tax=Timema bartmani TaxID=61472 RepID=A0A7R9EMX7_9NEOP|nr:unnamed protein product [Timema bartmani]
MRVHLINCVRLKKVIINSFRQAMRTEYTQGPGPGGMSRVLVLRGSEWECLKNRPQQVGEAERVAAQRAREQREELKKLSKAMTQDWEGTVEHIRWRSVEANRARREHDAAERNKRLNSLRNRRAEDKKKLIAECKKLIFYDRDHAKSLNKALLFSEISPSSAVELNTTSALANYATEAALTLASPGVDGLNLAQGAQRNFRRADDLVYPCLCLRDR